MGLANSKNDSDTIGWNNVKTEDVTANKHFISLSDDAKQLIANLNIPEVSDNQTSETNINSILRDIDSGLSENDKNKFYNLLSNITGQPEELSNTSPFISSEMYEHLVNSKTSEDGIAQQGGAKKNHDELNIDDSSSSTSSTSSYSSLEDILNSSDNSFDRKPKNNKQINNKKHKKQMKSRHVKRNQRSDSDLSYLSSSAHTGGEFSDSPKSVRSEESSVYNNSNSVSDEQKLRTTSISVNTEDINMVSEY
jgi:hypothetical protein